MTQNTAQTKPTTATSAPSTTTVSDSMNCSLSEENCRENADPAATRRMSDAAARVLLQKGKTMPTATPPKGSSSPFAHFPLCCTDIL